MIWAFRAASGRYYPYASAAFDISRNTATGATGGGKAHKQYAAISGGVCLAANSLIVSLRVNGKWGCKEVIPPYNIAPEEKGNY